MQFERLKAFPNLRRFVLELNDFFLQIKNVKTFHHSRHVSQKFSATLNCNTFHNIKRGLLNTWEGEGKHNQKHRKKALIKLKMNAFGDKVRGNLVNCLLHSYNSFPEMRESHQLRKSPKFPPSAFPTHKKAKRWWCLRILLFPVQCSPIHTERERESAHTKTSDFDEMRAWWDDAWWEWEVEWVRERTRLKRHENLRRSRSDEMRFLKDIVIQSI